MLNVLLIGIGQCGNRILDSINKESINRGSSVKELTGSFSKYFSKYKYKSNVVTIAINTALNDLKELRCTKSKDRIHIPNLHGVGANRIFGKEVFEKQKGYILKKIEERGPYDIAIVITSASGGTGSSFTPLLIEELKNIYDFPVYSFIVLPFREEGTLYLQNSAFMIKELQTIRNDGIILADNQYLRTIGGNIKDAYDNINTMISQRLLFLLDSLDSEMMMVTDLGDFKTVMNSGSGFATIGYYKSKKEISIKNAIKIALSPNGLLYSTDIYNEATRAMIIIKGDKKYLNLEEISIEIEQLTKSVGHVFKGIITQSNMYPEILCIFTLGATQELIKLYDLAIKAIASEKNKKKIISKSKEIMKDYLFCEELEPEY